MPKNLEKTTIKRGLSDALLKRNRGLVNPEKTGPAPVIEFDSAKKERRDKLESEIREFKRNKLENLKSKTPDDLIEIALLEGGLTDEEIDSIPNLDIKSKIRLKLIMLLHDEISGLQGLSWRLEKEKRELKEELEKIRQTKEPDSK
jgi:hypothetical protein